jgi:hypothetical protein
MLSCCCALLLPVLLVLMLVPPTVSPSPCSHMSVVELLPWRQSLVHLQTLQAHPCDELATNELTWIYANKLCEGADSMSEAACRKLVNDTKVCLAQSAPTRMYPTLGLPS